ncbi:MAG: acetate/propionate family kinase [Verrucomicrobia bacterium]|nr:acetate/propionate family kinase [Verrucomicrobiota bacterium]
MAAPAIILTLNSGSSSLKFAVFENRGRTVRELARGSVAGTRSKLETVLDALAQRGLPAPTRVGHRLVHGGPHHLAHARLTPRVQADLQAAVPFAPLHLPAELALIDAVAKRFPALPQYVCFDTAFHAALPERARRLPLPEAMVKGGVHRYGFHGLSYEYLVHTLGARKLGRAVLAHLGNGASLAAVRDGRPVDTTMGFTPAGGIMMGTRPGDLDPGVIVHWLRRSRGSAARLEKIITHESGLRAVSGTTGDMEALLACRRRDPRARLAVEMFCYQVRQRIGALAAALGGIDTLVFTGGIGEHAAEIRREICADLGHLGIRIDGSLNRRSAPVISPSASRCLVRVTPTDEDRMIARHVAHLD